MEAAWVAAERGHRVVLFERSPELGGQVNLIAALGRRAEMGEVVRWRSRRLAQVGVDVRLGTAADRAGLASLLDGDGGVALIATGSRPRRVGWYAALPHLEHIPGADLAVVYTTWDVLRGELDGRRHVVVVDGCGYYQSSDPVEWLAGRGVRVTAVSTTASFAEGIEHNDRPAFVAATRAGDVTFRPSSLVTAIEPDRVRLSDVISGTESVVEDVDAVVLSIGSDVVDGLYHELRADGVDVRRIGDCLAPRGIEHAVFEAHRVAREL